MGNSGSHDFIDMTDYLLFKYAKRTLYNKSAVYSVHDAACKGCLYITESLLEAMGLKRVSFLCIFGILVEPW